MKFLFLSLTLLVTSLRAEDIQGSRDIVFALEIDAKALAAELTERLPDREKSKVLCLMAIGIIQQWELKQVTLLLLNEKDKPIRALLLAADPDKKAFLGIATNPLFMPFLVKGNADSLSINWAAIAAAKDIPEEHKQIAIRNIAGHLAIGHQEVLKRLEGGSWELLTDSLASTLIKKTGLPAGLGSLALVLPSDLNEKWLDSVKNHKELSNNFMAKMMIGMVEAVAKEIVGSLGAPAMAASFAFDGADKRKLNIVQLFPTEKDAQTAKIELTRSPDDAEAKEFLLSFLEVSAEPGLDSKVSAEGRLVQISMGWSGGVDRDVTGAISEATIGYVMKRGGAMRRSTGPIIPEYINPPVAGVDLDKLQTDLQAQLQQRLFAQGLQKRRNQQIVQFELDPLDIPNQEMSSLSYSVVSVVSKEGQDIKGELKERPGRKPGQLRSLFRGHVERIAIPLKGDIKPEQLGKAVLKFTLKAPANLQAVNFKSTDSVGTTREVNGQPIRLQQIEGARARFRSKGAKGIKAYAFDSEGRCLASSGWSMGGRSMSFQFKGVVAEVWLFPVGAKTEITASVTLDLNDGKSIRLEPKPSADVRTRYARKNFRKEPATYQPFDLAKLDDLKVEWSDEHRGRLLMELPAGGAKPSVSFHPRWFGKDGPLMLKGNDTWHGNKFMWMAHGREGLSVATGVIGEANCTVLTGVEEFWFEKGEETKQKLKDGREMLVEINLNQMKRTMPADVFPLKFNAYNADGRQLFTNGFGTLVKTPTRTVTCWGQVQKVQLTVATKEIKKTIPFEILKEGADKAAFEIFKKKSALESALEKELHPVGQALRNYPKPPFDNFACLYFNHNRNGKPHKGIPERMAKACKAGAKRFGYEPAPYKGYFISILDKQIQGGKETPFSRNKNVAKWDGGEGEIESFSSAALLFQPVDDKSATYVIGRWGKVYKKYLKGEKPKAMPDVWKDGWLQIRKPK